MTEPQPTRTAGTDPVGSAVHLCGHCRQPVVATQVGWTHVDQRGQLASWLCASPGLMTLADPYAKPAHQQVRRPAPGRRGTTVPPSSARPGGQHRPPDDAGWQGPR
ncbi:MAG: hypothetical protein ACRDUA_00745 [Micromonosporaceae bacterium]